MIEIIVAIIALTLTVAMFALRQRLLAWPAVIFWMIFGANEYINSAAKDWTDMHYVLFFAGAVGMAIFCALVQFGLREQKDTPSSTDEEEYPDEGANPDDVSYMDERKGEFPDETIDEDGIVKDEFIGRRAIHNPRRNALHRRSDNRKTRIAG